MSIYVIGDLHLSFSVDKPMDIFGDLWENHTEKLKNNWIEKYYQVIFLGLHILKKQKKILNF